MDETTTAEEYFTTKHGALEEGKRIIHAFTFDDMMEFAEEFNNFKAQQEANRG